MGRPSTTGAKGVVARQTAAGVAYRIVYAGPDGKRVFEPAGSDKRKATKMLADRKAAVLRGDWQPLASARAATGTETGEHTVRSYSETWLKARRERGVRNVDAEEQQLRDYILPFIGDKLLADVRRTDVLTTMARCAKGRGKCVEKLAPGTVRVVYAVLHTLFADAVVDELVPGSPCTLRAKRGDLPEKGDADPAWRETAVYNRDEVEQLISDERLPLLNRVTYALLFLTGMRVGEVVGRRWRDLDNDAAPLARLTVATQYADAPLKTKKPRIVPVHPLLAVILDEWRRHGFVVLYGRHPLPDDYLIPAPRSDEPRRYNTVWSVLQRDLTTLGLRRRRVHDARRTFITLALKGGARRANLERITHGGVGSSVFDRYESAAWEDLCAAVSCLKVERQVLADVVPLRRVGT